MIVTTIILEGRVVNLKGHLLKRIRMVGGDQRPAERLQESEDIHDSAI